MKKFQDIKHAICEYIMCTFPERENLSVRDIEKVRVGASHGIYTFTAYWHDEAFGPMSEGLVIRVEPDVGLAPPYDIRPEYEVLKRLRRVGIPVPKVFHLEEDSRVLGRPFILMEKIEGGEPLVDAWMKHPEYRDQLMEDYISVVTRIHGLDLQNTDLTFLGVPENNIDYAKKEIVRWEKVVAENQYTPYPIMAELFSWLRTEIPSGGYNALCHGDCTPHNAFVRDGRIVAMLDWEMARIGDPISDIGWSIFFSSHIGEAIGFKDWDETRFIRRYEEMTGEKIDEKRLLFWKVLAYVKASAIAIAAVKAGLESKDINMQLFIRFGMDIARQQDKAARMLGF